MLSTGVAFAADPVAYVYVQEDSPQTRDTGPSPVSVYAASADSTVTMVNGSPFNQTMGVMVGTNGKQLITLDADSLRSYAVSSNGGIGPQTSELDTRLYSGSGCRGESPLKGARARKAELDRTGEHVYMIRNGRDLDGVPVVACSDIQVFKISASGDLTFQKNTVHFDNRAILDLTVTGNGKYALVSTRNGSTGRIEDAQYARASDGVLVDLPGVSITYPRGIGDLFYQFLPEVASDRTDNLAVAVEQLLGCYACAVGDYQLATYSFDSYGSLVTPSTFANMPTVKGCCLESLRMNPAGKILAVSQGSDISFFEFNGGAPMTPLAGSRVIHNPDGRLVSAMWDNDDHLYALDRRTGGLHVYTVTEKAGAVEAPGSPYSNVPFCGYDGPPVDAPGCTQTVRVKSIP